MASKLLGSGEFLGDVGKLLLRVTLGADLMIAHGIPKIQKWADLSQAFPDPLGLGHKTSLFLVVFAEAFCSGLVVLGAFTRLALIPILINLSVAFLVFHAHDSWQTKDLAFVFLMGMAAVFFAGPGKWSADGLFHKSAAH